MGIIAFVIFIVKSGNSVYIQKYIHRFTKLFGEVALSEDRHFLVPLDGIIIWLSSIIVMIFPVLGFIVSSIVSLVVPKDKIYKIFVRFCLMAHILCSIAVAYLYYNDMINLSIIKSYIGNFNIL